MSLRGSNLTIEVLQATVTEPYPLDASKAEGLSVTAEVEDRQTVRLPLFAELISIHCLSPPNLE